MTVNNEIKKKIAEAMRNLEEAILNDDLACMFMFEEELTRLTSADFSMAFMADITEANKGKGKVVIDVYLEKIFSEGGNE